MNEHKLDCCVVRDLLPSYLEELTEPETTTMVKEHLDGCPACSALEQDMRCHLPVEPAPKRAAFSQTRQAHPSDCRNLVYVYFIMEYLVAI